MRVRWTLNEIDQECKFRYSFTEHSQPIDSPPIEVNMSRRGNCWDNAPQESFYGHMKDELADKMALWETFDDARRDVDD